jgi:hypothetical protein
MVRGRGGAEKGGGGGGKGSWMTMEAGRSTSYPSWLLECRIAKDLLTDGGRWKWKVEERMNCDGESGWEVVSQKAGSWWIVISNAAIFLPPMPMPMSENERTPQQVQPASL